MGVYTEGKRTRMEGRGAGIDYGKGKGGSKEDKIEGRLTGDGRSEVCAD